MLEDHALDDQSLACNGEALLVWPASKKVKEATATKQNLFPLTINILIRFNRLCCFEFCSASQAKSVQDGPGTSEVDEIPAGQE